MTVGRARALKLPSIVIDRGGKHYRGAQVRAINGATATIRLHREHHLIIDRTCSTPLLNPQWRAGQPVCVEVSDPSGACTIVAVFDALVDPVTEAAWQKDGQTFAPGFVPKSLGGNEGFY